MASIQSFLSNLQSASKEFEKIARLEPGARLVPYEDHIEIQFPPGNPLHKGGQALRRWTWSTEDEIKALQQHVCEKAFNVLNTKRSPSSYEKMLCEKSYVQALDLFKKHVETFLQVGLVNYRETCVKAPSHILTPYPQQLEDRGEKVDQIRTYIQMTLLPLMEEVNLQFVNFNKEPKVNFVASTIRNCLTDHDQFIAIPRTKVPTAIVLSVFNQLFGNETVKTVSKLYGFNETVFMGLADMHALLIGIAAKTSPTTVHPVFFSETHQYLKTFFNLSPNSGGEILKTSTVMYSHLIPGNAGNGRKLIEEFTNLELRLEQMPVREVLECLTKMRSIKSEFLTEKPRYAQQLLRDKAFLSFTSSGLHSYLQLYANHPNKQSLASYLWEDLSGLWADYLVQFMSTLKLHPITKHDQGVFFPSMNKAGLLTLNVMHPILITETLQILAVCPWPFHEQTQHTYNVSLIFHEPTNHDSGSLKTHQKEVLENLKVWLQALHQKCPSKDIAIDLLGQGTGSRYAQESVELFLDLIKEGHIPVYFIGEINVYGFRPLGIPKKTAESILEKVRGLNIHCNFKYFHDTDTPKKWWGRVLLGEASTSPLPQNVKTDVIKPYKNT